MKYSVTLLMLSFSCLSAMQDDQAQIREKRKQFILSLSNKWIDYYYCDYKGSDGQRYRDLIQEKKDGEFPGLPPIVVATYKIAERPS